jgi:uncharacterized protein YndB with AHSA1/START domain
MKWVLRIFAGLVVLVALVAWWGYSKYKKFTAGGNTTTVSIHAPAERVFASLANADSVTTWVGPGATPVATRHGMMQPGDTLRVESTSGRGSRNGAFTWMVTEVRLNQLLAMELRADTSNSVFATRRDSLVQMGDSTLVITTVGSPMFDSARTTLRDSVRKGASVMLDFGSKIALSAFRVQSENELRRLKAHIEGRPLPQVERAP